MTESAYTVPGAPRLVLLSDLHGRPYREFIRSVQDFRPEMICITGDLITGILPEDEISPLVSAVPGEVRRDRPGVCFPGKP